MIELKHILLPTDFSETALQATRYALELGKRFGAKLHLLHVIEDPVLYLSMFESFPLPAREEFETFAQTRLENWILPEDLNGWLVVEPQTEFLVETSERAPEKPSKGA